MIPVIITRAQPGADETAARVSAMGHMPLVSPALQLVANTDVALPERGAYESLVFTSANGVRFYAERTGARDKTAWCVGPATAAAAREAGFGDVQESAGNAIDLAAFIAQHRAPNPLPVLHIANAAAKGNLASALNKAGLEALFAPIYRAETAPMLSPAVEKILGAKLSAIVLVHSAKGAAAFAALAADLPTAHLSAVAISVQAAKPLMSLGVGEIHIARAPHEDGLFAAFGPAAAILSA